MNVKRMLLAALAVFVSLQIMDFVVHQVLLSAEYEAAMELWRPDMMEMMWLNYVAGVILCLFFTYVFAKGYEGKGIPEGLRYGIVFTVGYHLVHILSQYFVYPIPWSLMMKWLLFGTIEFIILGVVVSLIYKSK